MTWLMIFAAAFGGTVFVALLFAAVDIILGCFGGCDPEDEEEEGTRNGKE